MLNEPTPLPRRGKIQDVDIARQWVAATRDEMYFCLSPDAKPEWYRIEGKRQMHRSLQDCEVDSLILQYIEWLVQDGCSIRITATRVSAVRRLSVLLRLQARQGGQNENA